VYRRIREVDHDGEESAVDDEECERDPLDAVWQAHEDAQAKERKEHEIPLELEIRPALREHHGPTRVPTDLSMPTSTSSRTGITESSHFSPKSTKIMSLAVSPMRTRAGKDMSERRRTVLV